MSAQRSHDPGRPATALPDLGQPQPGAAVLAALQALPAEMPVVALLYEGDELIDARWTTRAAVTATLAARQPDEAAAQGAAAD